MGYRLPSAIADLVDNSIAADATDVEVHVEFAGSDSWIRIADNGEGMATRVLNEAMRYGTDREYAETDLGRFGLGLKTASLSQCRRLTVATRVRARGPIQARQWDLDEVEQRDRWELRKLASKECCQEVKEPLRGRRGTVVLWERLDRVLAYRLPSGVAAEHGLARQCRDIEEHLAMVFHRFLSGEGKRVLPLKITLNGNEIEPWDPYAREEQATRALPVRRLRCRRDGRDHSIVIRPYVLPSQAQFSSIRAHAGAAGPRKWNRQQGFYIYRGDRMIQSGGWNRLRTSDEHTKLARIGIEFQPKADGCFEINVPKMTIRLPVELRGEFAVIAQEITRSAQRSYRGRGESSGAAGSGGRMSRRSKGARKASSGRDDRSNPAGDVASSVVGIVRRELAHHPRVLARVLGALSRLGPEFADAASGRGSRSSG